MVAGALAQAAIGGIATWVFKIVVADETAQNVGIIIIWLAVVVGVAALFSVSLLRSPSAADRLPGGHPAHNRRQADAFERRKSLKEVSGETLVKDVLSAQGHLGICIPLQEVEELKLGEVALLRRLTVCRNLSASRTRCEFVLTAAGITAPSQSLVRLVGRELIEAGRDEIALVESKGKQAANDFTECLIHDPQLTAAYRVVTLAINKTIRFDGKPLVPSPTEYHFTQ